MKDQSLVNRLATIALMVLIGSVGALTGFVVGNVAADVHPVTVPAPGTVERRLHFTIDTRWDTDKRRRFTCREE